MQVNPWLRLGASILVGGIGVVGTFFISEFIKNWGNEIGNIADEKEATAGRATSDASNQQLNEQTAKFPKD